MATPLLITLGLLAANGFFVGAEFALMAARRSRVEHLASVGERRARTVLRCMRELSLMLAGAQLGITMASLGLGYVAEPAVATLLEAGLHAFVDLPSGLLHTVSLVLALTIVVYLHMVIGEMAPKNIAISEPERTVLWLASPFRLYVNAFRPFIRFLNMVANAGLRVLRVEPRDELASAHAPGELKRMIEESAREGMLGSFERELLTGAIGFGTGHAGGVMVPRVDVVAVPITATPAELEHLVVETGHSRIPVYRGDLDDLIGFIHAKDLLDVGGEDRDKPFPKRLIRPLLAVPASRKLHALLLDMRRERQQLALVFDELGGTAGILTLEDVVEELVGEIQDEYDPAELAIVRLGAERYDVPGSVRIEKLPEQLGFALPEGHYETVAGFIMDRLGRIPRPRDEVRHDRWRFVVRHMAGRRIVRVRIERDADAGAEKGS